MAPQAAQIRAQIGDRRAFHAGGMRQRWKCAGNQVDPGLDASPTNLDDTWACLFQGQLIFERTPATRHNTDTKSCHFACNRCFEMLNANLNNM